MTEKNHRALKGAMAALRFKMF